jgi:hypothetical protein
MAKKRTFSSDSVASVAKGKKKSKMTGFRLTKAKGGFSVEAHHDNNTYPGPGENNTHVFKTHNEVHRFIKDNFGDAE